MLSLSQAQMASGKIFFEILVDPQVQLELKTEEKEPLTLHCFPGSAYYPHCFSRTKGYVTLTELGEIYEQDKLVGYHTETWEAVSSYMMYENYAKSFTVSLAYEGLTRNLTLNYLQGRVSTEYLANPSKRSKLALFSSFKIKKYRRDYFNEKHEKVKTFEFLMVIPEDMHSAVVNQ